MTPIRSVAVAAAFATVAAMGTANAEEEKTPFVSGEISIEIENDWTHHSEDPANELNDLFATVEPSIKFRLLPGLTLHVAGTMEPVRDPGPSDDRVFEDHGLYLSDLLLEFERPFYRAGGTTYSVAVYSGKFTPNFGIAWDRAPGVFGTDFTEDYELAERLGVGGRLTLANERFGSHAFSLNSYFVDTFLDSSAITSRGTTELADGGVGNTEDLSSFTFAIDGADMPAFPGFSYHLGFVRQAAADVPDVATGTGTTAEHGFAIAGEQMFHIGPDGAIEVVPLMEFAHFGNAEGMPGQDRSYLTMAVGAAWDHWNAAVVYTNRKTNAAGSPDVDDNLYQLSIGYVFDFGLAIDVGYKISEVADVTSQTLGIVAGYVIEF